MKLIRQLLSVTFALLWSATLASAIPGRAEVKKIVGTATLINATGASSSLAEGMALGTGDTVSTGPGSTVDLWLGLNGEALRVDPDTTLKLDTLDIANVSERKVTTALSLTKGGVTGHLVNKLSTASKYEIRTPTGVAGIRGTTFSLTPSGRLVVTVGVVNFSFVLNGVAQSVTVSAGQKFTVGVDNTPQPASKAEVAAINNVAAVIAKTTGTGTVGIFNVTADISTIENPLSVSVSQ